MVISPLCVGQKEIAWIFSLLHLNVYAPVYRFTGVTFNHHS